MKWLLPAVLALVLVGCGKESVTGIWKGRIEVDDANGRIRRQANRMGNPVLELKTDGSFTLAAGMKLGGKWSESEDGSKITFTVLTINDKPLSETQYAAMAEGNDVQITANVSEDRQRLTVASFVNVQAEIEFMR